MTDYVQRDREMARIREEIRRTTRDIIRLARQEMIKAHNRMQQKRCDGKMLG